MANYTQLIKTINDNIKANGNQEITGPVLNAVLRAMVSALGEGYQFMGIATPDTNPGTPDGKVFYIATEPGVYSNFGVIVPNGSIGIISNTSGDWEVNLINTYYEIDVDTLMQDSPSSDDIDKAIGSLSNLRRAITVGVPFVGRSASGRGSTVAIAQVKQLSDTEVRVVMLNTGTVDGSNELVPIIKKITNSAGQLSLSTEAPTSFIGPLSSLSTSDKGSVVGAINEVAQTLLQVAGQMKNKQDKLKAGTGVEITSDNTVNVTLDTTVFKVVASLPESPAAGDENKIHLVPAESTEEGNIYTEYVYVNGKWEEFGTYKSEVDLTPYLKKTDAESTYQKINDSTLSTKAKTVVGAINENTGNVTRIDRAVGNPVIEEVDLTQIAEAGYYWTVAGAKISNANYSLVRVTLQKGDLLIATVMSSLGVAQLTVVDDTGNKAVELIPSEGKASTYITSSYYANKDCNVDISKYGGVNSNTKAYIIKSPFNTAISDNSYMQYLHKVYEEYGAVYNAETGYWELNGLTDMTEEDMWDIYLAGVPRTENLTEFYSSRSIRTTFNFAIRGGGTGKWADFSGTFISCKNIEIVQFYNSPNSVIYVKRLLNVFYDCQKLREIVNVIQINSQDALMDNAFHNCKALKSVKLHSLRKDISFKDSPLLSYESLNYLVTNAANTGAITVTVHPTTYSYLTGTAQPAEEVGGTAEDWLALVTTAQGKQISFAQPAETLEVEPLE